MTAPRSVHPPVTLFFGILVGDVALFDPIEKILQHEFSPILDRSETVPFTFTNYYNKEMGDSILRRWVAVEWMIDTTELPAIKLHTNRIEETWSEERGGALCRKVNIDPGYLDLCRIVLASCKEHDHRLHLGQGVFGEVTLTYRRASHSYESLPWSYPDYRSPTAQEFFLRLRANHRERAERWKPGI